MDSRRLHLRDHRRQSGQYSIPVFLSMNPAPRVVDQLREKEPGTHTLISNHLERQRYRDGAHPCHEKCTVSTYKKIRNLISWFPFELPSKRDSIAWSSALEHPVLTGQEDPSCTRCQAPDAFALIVVFRARALLACRCIVGF